MDKQQRSERGQSMVEFAVSLVLLFILLAGTVDLGRAMFVYMALRDAAQEGALFGSVQPTETAAIQSRVINSSNTMQSLFSGGGLSINVSTLGDPCGGNGIEIDVVYSNFGITTPFLGGILGTQTLTIRAEAVDTILTPACS